MEGAKLLELLDDVSPEYAAAATRYFGEEQGQAWIAQLRGQPMARVAIRPNWVAILDFQTRFPSTLNLQNRWSSAGLDRSRVARLIEAEPDPAGKSDGRQQAPALVADRPGDLDFFSGRTCRNDRLRRRTASYNDS